MATTVMLVEDDPSFLARFCAIVAAAPELRLLGAVGDLASARRLLAGAPPDVLLTDLGLPDGSGIELIRETAARHPATDIKERVRDKQRELERQFGLLQRLTREAAVAEERRRLMADMHDGIGASLISALSLVECGEASSAQLATALRECIDDLRLAIDSLEPADGELAPVLGGLRYRLEPRLKAQGIGLDWQVQEVPRLACLTPQNVLHILRILQEAFANVLKHAHAQHVRVATAVGDGCAFIEICDDGRGFDAASSTRGQGLDNMRQRAKVIGGDLKISPSAAGTTLLLSLPIGRAS